MRQRHSKFYLLYFSTILSFPILRYSLYTDCGLIFWSKMRWRMTVGKALMYILYFALSVTIFVDDLLTISIGHLTIFAIFISIFLLYDLFRTIRIYNERVSETLIFPLKFYLSHIFYSQQKLTLTPR